MVSRALLRHIFTTVSIPFKANGPPAPKEELRRLVEAVGIDLPAAYVEFLLQSNGAEGGRHDQVGDSLRILPAGEVILFNEDYGIRKFLPDLIAFASDGGDHAFCFHVLPGEMADHWPILRQPLGALFAGQSVLVAGSFLQWQEDEFRYDVS
jgi:hypothetical protein